MWLSCIYSTIIGIAPCCIHRWVGLREERMEKGQTCVLVEEEEEEEEEKKVVAAGWSCSLRVKDMTAEWTWGLANSLESLKTHDQFSVTWQCTKKDKHCAQKGQALCCSLMFFLRSSTSLEPAERSITSGSRMSLEHQALSWIVW